MSTIIIFNFMSELGKIVLYLCLAIPVLSFLFCSIFGANIGGSFDRGEYKLWVKENIQGSYLFKFASLHPFKYSCHIRFWRNFLINYGVFYIVYRNLFMG